MGPEDGNDGSCRGGSFSREPAAARAARRGDRARAAHEPSQGLRLVRSL